MTDNVEFDTGSITDKKVIFSHPLVSKSQGDLVIHVNPNSVEWSYGLNTANFPTYGGEVVQILSIFVDDMTITGDIRSYGDMERIYQWFLLYMQSATQGDKLGAYDPHPVNFSFPERGWNFNIYPKNLPGFKYSRDVVVPSYTIEAAVLDADDDLKKLITDNAAIEAYGGGDISGFGKATAAIGFIEDNPFSGPTFDTFTKEIADFSKAQGDFFQQLVQDWSNHDFKDLTPASGPTDPNKVLLKGDKIVPGQKGNPNFPAPVATTPSTSSPSSSTPSGPTSSKPGVLVPGPGDKSGNHVTLAFAKKAASTQFPSSHITGSGIETEAPKGGHSQKVYTFDFAGGNEVLVSYATGEVLQWEDKGGIHRGNRNG